MIKIPNFKDISFLSISNSFRTLRVVYKKKYYFDVCDFELLKIKKFTYINNNCLIYKREMRYI